MKKIIYTVISALLLINCGKGTQNKDSVSNGTPVVTSSSDSSTSQEAISTTPKVKDAVNESSNRANSNSNSAKANLNTSLLLNTITEFQLCKANSQKRSDCRNAISEFITSSYSINDFKDEKNTPVIFDSIQPILAKSSAWKNIGSATSQSTLDEAMNHAANDGLALIIDTSKTYGHVVVVLDGEAKKSGSWGLKLPKVLSLANHNASKSFYDKTLAYAFKKSESLQVYLRK